MRPNWIRHLWSIFQEFLEYIGAGYLSTPYKRWIGSAFWNSLILTESIIIFFFFLQMNKNELRIQTKKKIIMEPLHLKYYFAYLMM